MTNRKIVTSVYLTLEQDEALELLAEATRVKRSEYLREGVDLIIERYKDSIERRKKERKMEARVAI